MKHEITITTYKSSPEKLAVLFPARAHNLIQDMSEAYECNKSDIARAAMALGLKALENGADATGLPIAHWIAALNGKVK